MDVAGDHGPVGDGAGAGAGAGADAGVGAGADPGGAAASSSSASSATSSTKKRTRAIKFDESYVPDAPQNQQAERVVRDANGYALDATGARLAFLAVNFNTDAGGNEATFLVELAGAGAAGARTEWHLTGSPGVAHAPVLCNGEELAFSGLAPPDWQAMGAKVADGDALTLKQASVAFALVF